MFDKRSRSGDIMERLCCLRFWLNSTRNNQRAVLTSGID